MLKRSHFIQGREGFKGFKRDGAIYLEPPAPPTFEPMPNAHLLAYGGKIEHFPSNWLRLIVHAIFPSSRRRRSILSRI